MPNYNVRINLNSISLNLDAEDENHAFELAYEIALNETQYDLLKWAEYDIEVNNE
jgi:hypothetical protein